jgi:hypothetical protein
MDEISTADQKAIEILQKLIEKTKNEELFKSWSGYYESEEKVYTKAIFQASSEKFIFKLNFLLGPGHGTLKIEDIYKKIELVTIYTTEILKPYFKELADLIGDIDLENKKEKDRFRAEWEKTPEMKRIDRENETLDSILLDL